MYTATARRTADPDTLFAVRLAVGILAAIMLFLAVFAAGYAEINLIAGTVRVVVTTWHVVTSPWTYVVLAFLYGAYKILRGGRG
jgi:hypothetical protein